MVYLNDEVLETVVGGQSLAEYALIGATLPKVAEHNPNAKLSSDMNEHAFNALFQAAVLKIIHTTDG